MKDEKKNFLTRSPVKRSFLSIALSATLLIVFFLFIASMAEAQVKAKVSTGAGSAPTEATLGAPIYPGSTYDAQNSQGMSGGGSYKYYIFISNDSTDKVSAFYEQKLKVKAGKYDNSYMIPIKGTLPMPDEGISIQPNTLGGKSANAKTMITFQKQAK